MALFPFNLHGKGTKKDVVDFNYPQSVQENAVNDLNKALKSGNGNMAVDALVRYSIALSGISQEKMPDIISRIDSTITIEKKPEIKSLLYYFQAYVFKCYSDRYCYLNRHNAADEVKPDDYTEWDQAQFNVRIAELINKALHPELVSALQKKPITKFNDIIVYDKMGPTYVPTLFEFLSMKCMELAGETDNLDLKATIATQWKEATATDVAAHIFAIMQCDDESGLNVYNKYKDNVHSGLALTETYGNAPYEAYMEYVKRFPGSFYTPTIKNRISTIEAKSVEVNYPEHALSTEKIEIKVNSRNVNDADIMVYRVPDYLVNRFNLGRYSNIDLKKLKLVQTIKVHTDGTVPFRNDSQIATVDPLPYGMYVFVPQYSVGGKTVTSNYLHTYDLLIVSDILMFTVGEEEQTDHDTKNASSGKHENKDLAFAVNARTGAPMSGVTISTKNVTLGTTDANGCIQLDHSSPKSSVGIVASKDDDRYGKPMYRHTQHKNSSYPSIGVKMFTDLGVYRPGETVKWALVCYEEAINTRNVKPDMQLIVTFSDPNSKEIETAQVTTDEFGRAQGSFVIPTDRINGAFYIAVKGNGNTYCHQYVNVSEYKTPTFDITFPEAKHSFTKGQTVTLKGLVETYSGMPVANAPVRIKLSQNEWTWWWRFKPASQGNVVLTDTITTDAKGVFTIEVPAEKFEENNGSYRWAHYNYCVEATCTDAAGETHEASHSFIIGTRQGISIATGSLTHLNAKPLKVPLKYNSTSDENAHVTCEWQLTDVLTKQTVKTGVIDTANPTIDLTALPSAQYDFTVAIQGADEDDEDAHAKTKIILYKNTDKIAPVPDTSMWIPEAGRSVDDNNVAHITIGTSTPEAHIYYIAESRNEILQEGWLHYTPGIHHLNINVPQGREEFIHIVLTGVYNKVTNQKEFTMVAPACKQSLKVKATSFRNKLVPGEREHWTLQMVDKDGKPQRGAIIFEMFDKAINSISSNTWSLSVPYHSTSRFGMSNMHYYGNNHLTAGWTAPSVDENTIELPYLYLYDQSIFGFMRRSFMTRMRATGAAALGGIYMAKNSESCEVEEAMAAPFSSAPIAYNKSEEILWDEAVVIKDADILDGGTDEATAGTLNNVKMRVSDVKTALWLPMLTADEKGNVQIEFDAPEFNTTWAVQAIGMNRMLYTDVFSDEVLTQKPIMVKANSPRFLRHGDVATLIANVQNATDSHTNATAVIELFDPRSGEVYTSRTTKVSMDGMGSQAVNIDWTVPADIPFVGLRVKAATDTYGDGEQIIIPVLEATSPVIETKPFYIEAGAQHFATTLPQFTSKARVTLEYCDNPMWYCITALPTIFNENSEISTTLAHNLFAIEIAQGIAAAQPQIKEAVNYWKSHDEDSTLVSMLAKNQDLKVGTLLASPWVKEADRQTLRMSRISELLDEAVTASQRNRIIESLEKMQQPDGGWPWFVYPMCKSSVYVTEEVLEILGEIKHVGFLHDDPRLTEMTRKAIAYLDRETLRQYKEQKDKNDLGSYSSYAYVRTLHNSVAQSAEAKSLFDKVLKYMNKNWGNGLSLGTKAFYAMTLNRNGYSTTARNIMESVRQFALVKPELGMYWDNLQVGWRYFDKVAITATILQALNECDPRTQEINDVRKWMLLMKQSNDWGSSSLAADAVYSLVTTGTQWLERNPMPTVSIGSQIITFDKIDEYLGYCRKTIEAQPGQALKITRSGNSPAWGAVYTQFTAPMTQIPQVAIDEISIAKEFYRYTTDGAIVPATSFNVGDKVQVRLVIKNNKDLDFVTVKDERAACFEPVDKLSHYQYADNDWFFHETKDAVTNLFFSDLQKGTHVIKYDLYVTASGQFSAGIATAQCQYAPQLTAHSAGSTVIVK